MTQMPPPPNAPFYRLNPYFFLSDRKIWVSLSILLMLLSYGLVSHILAMCAGYRAGARADYWITLGLLGVVPILLHWLAPLFARTGSWRVIATLPAEKEKWRYHLFAESDKYQEVPPADLDAISDQLLSAAGLSREYAPWILALLMEIEETYNRVSRYAAGVAGRAISDLRHRGLKLVVSNQPGSPYCRAYAIGPVEIVFPIGALAFATTAEHESPAAAFRSARRYLSVLLAHELSHVLLRDEPISLFADPRLISIAVAVESASVALLALLFPAMWFTPSADPLSGSHAGTGVVGLVVLSMLGQLFQPRMKRWIMGRFQRRGPGWLVMASSALVGAVLLSFLVSRFCLIPFGGGTAIGKVWPIAYLSLAIVVLLGRLCLFLGRRQIEFIADETAVNALSDGNVWQTRDFVAKTLHATYGALVQSPVQPTPAPSYAVGHSAGFLELRAFRGSFTEVLTELAQRWQRELASWSPLIRRTLGLPVWLAARMAAFIGRQVHSFLLLLFRTHPTLLERIAVVQQPDLQVEQDPSVPLIYVTLALMTLPYLAAAVVSHGGSNAEHAAVVVVLPILGFLLLSFLIARRPTRRSVVEADRPSVEIGFYTFVLMQTQKSDAPAAPLQTQRNLLSVRLPAASPAPRSTWLHSLRAWWNDTPQTIVPRPVQGMQEYEGRTGKATGFLEELWLVFVALLAAGGVGTVILRIVSRLEGETTALPLFGLFNMPPLGAPDLPLFIAAIALGWYLLTKFWSLARWHFYAGSSTAQTWLYQIANLLKAQFFWGVTAGILTVAVEVALRAGQMLWAGSELAGESVSVFRHSVMLYGGGFLLFGLCYAAIICLWPTLPSEVRCPLGHLVPMRWHNVLLRPTQAHSHWGWLRCPECQRAPQARSWLLWDEDSEAPSFRKSATGWFSLVGLLAVYVFLSPLWIWANGLISIDAIGRCRALSRIVRPEHQRLFSDCVSNTEPVPRDPKQLALLAPAPAVQSRFPSPPKPYAPLVDSTRSLAESSLYDPNLWSESLGFQKIVSSLDYREMISSLSCHDWLVHIRNEVAYVQACAYQKPTHGLEQCQLGALPEEREAWCRCLWADRSGADRDGRVSALQASRYTRLIAAQRMYRMLTSLVHNAKESCTVAQRRKDDEDQFGRAAWGDWHHYVEKEMAPRLFIALSMDRPPHFFLGAAERALEEAKADAPQELDRYWAAPVSGRCENLLFDNADKIKSLFTRFRRTTMEAVVLEGLKEHWKDKGVSIPECNSLSSLADQVAQCASGGTLSDEQRKICTQLLEKTQACTGYRKDLEEWQGHKQRWVHDRSELHKRSCEQVYAYRAQCRDPRLCPSILPAYAYCAGHFSATLECLSPSNFRRYTAEATSIVSTQEALVTKFLLSASMSGSEASAAPETFAAFLPSLLVMNQATQSLEQVVQLIQLAESTEAICDESFKQQTESNQQIRQHLLRLFPDGAPGNIVLSVSPDKPLHELMQKRRNELLCGYAKQFQARPFGMSSYLDMADGWLASLACEEVDLRKLVVQCKAMQNPALSKTLCGPEELGPIPCRYFLGIENGCDVKALGQTREQLQRLIAQPLDPEGQKLLRPETERSLPAEVAQRVRVVGLGSFLVCQSEMLGEEEAGRASLLDRLLCLTNQISVARLDSTKQKALPTLLARQLNLLTVPPPIENHLKEKASAMLKEVTAWFDSERNREMAKVCKPFRETERQMLLAWLASLRQRTSQSLGSTLQRLAEFAHEPLIRQHFATCYKSRPEFGDVQDCAQKVISTLRDIPTIYGTCISLGEQSKEMSKRLLVSPLSQTMQPVLQVSGQILPRQGLTAGQGAGTEPQDPLGMLGKCDWLTHWQMHLADLRSELARTLTRLPADPNERPVAHVSQRDSWLVLRDLAWVAKWRHTQVSGLPEYFNTLFPFFKGTWALPAHD